MTEFELFLNLVGLILFSILLCIKIDSNLSDQEVSWLQVFVPLFLVDLFQFNFCTILFIRQLKESRQRKEALIRFTLSTLFLLARLSFKVSLYFLIEKSQGKQRLQFKFQYSAVPIFFHMSLLFLKSCSLKKYQTLG
jgi:hypothetical protein